MPELPEVETTCRGLRPHLLDQTITDVTVRQSKLRWPVPDALTDLTGARIDSIHRRAKYLLFDTSKGGFLVHLGMSGSLRISHQMPQRRHDHIVIHCGERLYMAYHDPRRFGCILCLPSAPTVHPLLTQLGPEPLGADFTAAYLFATTRKKSTPIKQHIMQAKIVVGVGNIYASESLFHAAIRPGRAAQRLSKNDCERLVLAIRNTLTQAIAMGGSTLRDFVNSDGNPGYFAQTLMVYGRAGEACQHCHSVIKKNNIGQRSSFYCPQCQAR